jgi:hypothetical protein
MNDTVLALVDAIKTGDATTTENAFAAAIGEKITAKIEDMRQSISANMFKVAEEPTQNVEEPTE